MTHLNNAKLSALFAIVVGMLVFSPRAHANYMDLPDPQALMAEMNLNIAPDCACDADREALNVYAQEIADAPTLEAAQAIALDQTKLVNRAIRAAKRLPGVDTGDLTEVQSRLRAYEASVILAESQQGVSEAFIDFLRDASDKAPAMDHIKRKRACSMTPGQIIITVIGFVLGIIPGIILLILLC